MKIKYLQLLIALVIPTLIASQMLELKIKNKPYKVETINVKRISNKILDSNKLRFLEEDDSESDKTEDINKHINSTSPENDPKSKEEKEEKEEKVEITADIPLTSSESEFNETIIDEFNYVSHIWTVTAQVGEPNQAFNLELDTSISTTWLPSVDCKNCATPHKYNASASRTSRETNQTIKIEDYLGDLKGEVVYDNFFINSLGIELRSFPFIQAIELNKKKFSDLPEGKLALSNINKYGPKFSFLHSLFQSGKITKKVFALEFTNENLLESNEESKGEGKIYFGEMPERIRKLQKEQRFGKCNSTTSEDLEDEFRDGWTCEMTHLFFNQKNQVVNLTDALEMQNTRVIFDSSYEFIGMSRNFYDLIYLNYIKQNFKGMCRKSEKNEEIYFICNLDKEKLEQAESLFLILQGYVLELSAEDLFVKLDDNHNYLFAIKFFEEDDDDSKIILLGHFFLKNFITLFDAENDQVTFYSEKVYDITSDWNKWYNADYYSLLLSRYFYLAVGACVVVTIFLMFICFLLLRNIRRRNHRHGPLIENEIK